MLTSQIDIIITVLFTIGLAQITWISVMLLRKKVPPSTITISLAPLVSIWVLLWPLYENPIWVWAGIMLLALPILPAYSSRHMFWQHLRIAWSGLEEQEDGRLPDMWPFVSLIASLVIAAAFFQRIPEFGLGIALAASLAFPFASLLDRTGYLKLGFPLHPDQTLMGHIGLVFSVSLLCTWSIHIYHGIGWQSLLIATLIAGMASSMIRAFLPSTLMLPIATLSMGITLWLL
ncbi:MAG: hypothetical protein R8K54_07525 [Mariprofundaceae bacterium]